MEKEGDDGKRESSLVAMSHRSTPSSPDGNADGSDKCTNNQPEDTVIDMEEGVDIHGYDDSLYHHDYSFDVPHTNPVSVDTVNPLDDHILGGTKRPTETTDDSVGIKRYKTEDEGQKNTTLSTNKQWDAMFDRLVAFKERNGHCLVPKRYAEDPKLGTWVETQRVQYKRLQREYDATRGVESVQPNKRLNQERLRKLHEIGFAWSAKHVRKQRNNSLQDNGAPPIEDRPNASLPDADAPMHGTMIPMMNTLVDDNPVPVATTAPRPRKSEPRQAGRLNDQQWEEMYQRLIRYKEQFGDCLVPRKYEPDPKLSTWVETQRFLWNRDYRNASGGSVTNEVEQDRQYSASTMHSSSVDSMPDPTHVPHAAASLSDWSPGGDLGDGDDAAVVAAAAAAAADAVDEEVGSTGSGIMNMAAMKDSPTQPKRLTKERKEKLDAIGFVWSLRNKRIDDHWDEMFRQLVEYKEKHGDCLVPSRYEANLKLGKWVETQRYEYTKLKRAEANPNEKPEEMNQEELKLGEKPRVTNARLTEERLRRLESIGFEWKVRNKMKRYYDKQWQDMFDQLMDFKMKNGHTMVPKRFPDNPRLANWVHTQRIQYRKLMAGARKDNSDKDAKMPPTEDFSGAGDVTLSKEDEMSFRLTDERRRKLEEIGFVWSVRESDAKTDQNRLTRNSYDDLWDAMFERLKAFKEKYGNCLVPKRSREDPKLGTWVDTQRVQYKKMKKKLADQGVPFDEQKPSSEEMQEAKAQNKPVVGRLTEDRISRLNELGFVWSLRDDWTKHYEELKQFKKEHGHCNVPARYSKNRRLGIWVSAQRQQYKQMQLGVEEESGSRTTPLTEDRITLLNELGFTWTIRSRDSLGESWNQRLQELRDYMAIHGNCLVPSRYPPNPELGIWVGTQRTQYRLFIKAKESGQKIPGSSGMNEERIKQLEDLGFVWALRGQEGSRRDETMLQDPEIIQNSSMEPSGSVPEHQSFAQNNPSNNPEAILDESSGVATYHTLQEV